eukprot:gene12707-12837_t
MSANLLHRDSGLSPADYDGLASKDALLNRSPTAKCLSLSRSIISGLNWATPIPLQQLRQLVAANTNSKLAANTTTAQAAQRTIGPGSDCSVQHSGNAAKVDPDLLQPTDTGTRSNCDAQAKQEPADLMPAVGESHPAESGSQHYSTSSQPQLSAAEISQRSVDLLLREYYKMMQAQQQAVRAKQPDNSSPGLELTALRQAAPSSLQTACHSSEATLQVEPQQAGPQKDSPPVLADVKAYTGQPAPSKAMAAAAGSPMSPGGLSYLSLIPAVSQLQAALGVSSVEPPTTRERLQEEITRLCQILGVPVTSDKLSTAAGMSDVLTILKQHVGI